MYSYLCAYVSLYFALILRAYVTFFYEYKYVNFFVVFTQASISSRVRIIMCTRSGVSVMDAVQLYVRTYKNNKR